MRDDKVCYLQLVVSTQNVQMSARYISPATRTSCRSINVEVVARRLPSKLQGSHSASRPSDTEIIASQSQARLEARAMPCLSKTQHTKCMDISKAPIHHHSHQLSVIHSASRTSLGKSSIRIAATLRLSIRRHSPSHVFVPAQLAASNTYQRRTIYSDPPLCTLCDG